MRYRMKLRAPAGCAVPIVVDIDRLNDALAVRAAMVRLDRVNARPNVPAQYNEWEVWSVDKQGRLIAVVGRGRIDAVAS